VTVAVSSAPNASEVSAALAPCPSGACASSEFPGSPTGKLPCTSVACTSVTSDFATRCSSMSAALRSSVSGSACNVCVTDGFGGKQRLLADWNEAHSTSHALPSRRCGC
jgi:hypothetical protein